MLNLAKKSKIRSVFTVKRSMVELKTPAFRKLKKKR